MAEPVANLVLLSISACIVCRNEADKLDACLATLDWVDEVIVMDLASSDDSAAVAERHGARIVRREPVPIVEWVRNEVAANARNDWILVLDPDERVTPGLAAELRTAAARDDVDAVVMPRMNHDFGYPPSNPRERYEPQLRMYRRDRVAWPAVPNALPAVPEERIHRVAARDELVLVHDRSRSIPEVVDRVVRYAPVQAQAMLDRGQVFTARAMVTDLGRRAYRQFVQGRAWRDGVPGILRAGVLVAFHFYIWAMFWQLSGGQRTAADDRFVRRLGMLFAPGRGVIEVVQRARRLLRRDGHTTG
jgi:glycosyltransferase involved in cell wall biosynthesis